MKTTAYVLFILFSALSITATLRNQTYWPIAPYNMFSFYLNVRTPVLELIISDSRGRECRARAPRLLPFEFFRANAMVKAGLMDARLLHSLRGSLGRTSWGGFDEVHPSASCPAADYNQLRFELVNI